MSRRKRLLVRQSLGQSHNWHVGYWDKKVKGKTPDEQFRSFGFRNTKEEAEILANEISASKKHLYIY